MFIRATVKGDPCKHHYAISNSAELCVHGILSVGVLELRYRQQSVVDGLEEVLISSRSGLDGFGSDQQELSLFLKPFEHFSRL